jgi:hypothetical protein
VIELTILLSLPATPFGSRTVTVGTTASVTTYDRGSEWVVRTRCRHDIAEIRPNLGARMQPVGQRDCLAVRTRSRSDGIERPSRRRPRSAILHAGFATTLVSAGAAP